MHPHTKKTVTPEQGQRELEREAQRDNEERFTNGMGHRMITINTINPVPLPITVSNPIGDIPDTAIEAVASLLLDAVVCRMPL